MPAGYFHKILTPLGVNNVRLGTFPLRLQFPKSGTKLRKNFDYPCDIGSVIFSFSHFKRKERKNQRVEKKRIRKEVYNHSFI